MPGGVEGEGFGLEASHARCHWLMPAGPPLPSKVVRKMLFRCFWSSAASASIRRTSFVRDGAVPLSPDRCRNLEQVNAVR